MRTRIKICGVREPATVCVAVDAGADAIGLNFVPTSPRYISLADAMKIIEAVPPFVEAIGLFCDPSVEEMILFDDTGLRTIQLHGDETRDFVVSIPQHQVIKAVPDGPEACEPWRHPPANLSSLLIDAPRCPGEATGGTGRVVDWEALADVDRTGLPPLILAGGLTPDNVGEAIRKVRPYAVDVSSGVESSPGVKDPARIYAFCQAVRDADGNG